MTDDPNQPRDLSQPMSVDRRPWPSHLRRSPMVYVCVNRRNPDVAISCAPRGGAEVHKGLMAALAEQGVDIVVKEAYCLSACMSGPNIKILPTNTRLQGVRVSDIPEVVGVISDTLAERDRVLAQRRADSAAVAPTEE